ncbi:MAG: DegT/DnrJ/EryC1/StrS aminotransferase family protein [Candidatus Omnitrophota bacterium]
MLLPITKPVFDEDELELIARTLESGWVAQGPNVQAFEEQFRQFCGAACAVAASSCTTALHLGLLALGVRPGDEVLVPSFTYIATANAVEYCGAKPVFCDIDLDTFTIDPRDSERRITDKTKGIVPVSLFGWPLDYAWLKDLAQKHRLWILEDAACAFGARRNNVHAGTEADASAFSFHPRKAITTGEGGMLVTNNTALAETARCLRNHGASRSDLERHIDKGGSLLPDFNVLGYNYRMTDIQGAIGLAQMKKADAILAQRRQAAARYHDQLAEFSWLRTPQETDGAQHAYQSYVALMSPGDKRPPQLSDLDELNRKRNRMFASLEESGVSVRQGTHAVHSLGYYRHKYGLNEMDYPQSLLADRLSLTLPLFCGMEEKEIAYVADCLKRLERI